MTTTTTTPRNPKELRALRATLDAEIAAAERRMHEQQAADKLARLRDTLAQAVANVPRCQAVGQSLTQMLRDSKTAVAEVEKALYRATADDLPDLLDQFEITLARHATIEKVRGMLAEAPSNAQRAVQSMRHTLAELESQAK